MIFQPACSVQGGGGQSLSRSSGCQAGPRPGQGTLPSRGASYTHTHAHSDCNLKTPGHLTHTSLGCGRKLEDPEKTQWPRPGIDFVFFSHQCYNKTTLKETLFEGLPAG